ncbi:MAG: dynamin family protein [Ruegeria sp.]
MAKDTHIRFVSPRAWERIEQWSRRKPVFALMGEFSAGKSTLMNFLLRKHALPTQVTATQLPPVWFSWGNKPAYVQKHDGGTQPIDLDQLDQVGVNDAQFIRIYLEADILEAVDLIDTPGISDPKIQADVWRRAVGQANGVLWCTHSTQAWRETERATWVSLPERLQNNSLLLVTRADALGQKDRQKVLRRINREAGHLFNRTILFSARDAIVARDKTGDAELWSRSGGGKMIDSFLEITEQIMDHRADMLARYQIDKSLSGNAKIEPLRPTGEDELNEGATGAPLKLTDPLDDSDGFEAVRNSDDVIATFPVRPARVERRSDDPERMRIDTEEAERMRAEMAADAEPADDLRSLFREPEDSRLDISADPLGNSELNDFIMEDEFELEDDGVFGAECTDDQPCASESQEAVADDLTESLSDESADGADPLAVGEDTSNSDGAPGIEVSVSSITALLSKQTGDDPQSYEPEPESNALSGARIMTLSNDDPLAQDEPETSDEGTLEHLLNVPAGQPLSAATMWREVASSEVLPEDAEGLRAVFHAFLEEFDQIAREHSARREDDAPQAMPNPKDRAEWHVL